MENNKYISALKYHWLTNIYDRLISTFMPEKKFKNKLLSNVNIENKYNILDFGIGTATLSILAFEQNNKANYTGLDIDEKILKIAQQKISRVQANITLIKYDGGVLPFEDKSFDRIMSSLVIHHLTDEQKMATFLEFKRILKNDGELHIADWGFPKNKLQRFLFHIVQILDGYETTSANVEGRIPNLLRFNGFNNIQITDNFSSLLGTIQIFKIT